MWKSLVCTLILTEALLASSQSASVHDSCLSGECDHQDDTTMLQKKQELKVEVKPYMKQDTQSAFQTTIIVDQGKASKTNADNIVVDEKDVSGGDEEDVSGGVSGGDDDFEAAKKRLINTCDQIEKESKRVTKELEETQAAWDNGKLEDSMDLRSLYGKDYDLNDPASGCNSMCTSTLQVVNNPPKADTSTMPPDYIDKVIDDLMDRQCVNPDR
mmetsp:Transcript_143867/g.250705  ORF Transcript_143867/g.250705 Transcript_143867/m.250705 type:complete len:214 (-) Transcript_143867:126-767(-)